MSATKEEIKQLIAATGKYELQTENTEGANAYVFRARHLLLDQPVFLKVLTTVPEENVFAEPRLLVEATKAGEGESHVVRVFDAQLLGHEYVLVAMESVEGGSILSRLKAGPLPLAEAIRGAVGVLHGLAQLHQALLVHRDIKPANVVLSERYGRIWPKIADFGSVAKLPQAGASVSASRHSALYVPPESWLTPSRYDARSDLYQAGIVLFEMVHGSLPSDDDAYLDRRAKRELKQLPGYPEEISTFDWSQVVERALARAASNKGVVAFGERQPYVPTSLARIINKALAQDPRDRYQTPSNMIGDLEALRLPSWRPSSCNQEFTAPGWSGWDWEVKQEEKTPGQWVIRRRRPSATSFRRWGTAESARKAFQLVKEVAT